MRDSWPVVRVGYTLEQCWHRVPGGTATSALGTAAALQQREDIELVGVAARHRGDPPAPWTPPIPVRHLPLPRQALYECWHALRWPRVQRATGNLDVIHATGMAIPPRSAPLVVTVHDLAFLRYPDHATRHGQRFFKRSLELTRRDADLVLCPSEATRRDCLAYGFDGERVRVVPWGIDVASAASPLDATARVERLGLGGTRFVLWVGTVEPRKNLRTLLDAFARLEQRNVTLVLAGQEGWNEDIGPRVARLEPRVRMLGFVNNDDLRALYAYAAVFCYPSLLEGFGLPVLEAMAAGTAVLTSEGTATEEVVGDAGVVVDPHDPIALADALAALLDDDDRRAKLGHAARDRAATFTWERTAAQTAAAYKEVAR